MSQDSRASKRNRRAGAKSHRSPRGSYRPPVNWRHLAVELLEARTLLSVALSSVTSSSGGTINGSNSYQYLLLNGSGFSSGSTVTLSEPAFGYTFPGLATTYLSSSQLELYINLANDGTTWTAQVKSGSVSSNTCNFTVYAPSPVITSLSQSSATAGGSAFTLTAYGSTFETLSTIRWNGTNLTTTPVENSGDTVALTATVPAADIASAGTDAVTVYSSGPGGGTSPAVNFSVNSSGPTTYTLGMDFAVPRDSKGAAGSASWGQLLSSAPAFVYIKATQDTVGVFLPNDMPPTLTTGTGSLAFGLYDFADPTQYYDPATKTIRQISPTKPDGTINSDDISADAKAEADLFYETASVYLTAGHLLPALDLEYNSGFGFDSDWNTSTGWAAMAQWVSAWTSEFQNHPGMGGIFPILYMNQFFAGGLWQQPLINHSSYKLWIALGNQTQPVPSPGDQYWNPSEWDWAIQQYKTGSYPTPDLDALNPSSSLTSLEIGQSAQPALNISPSSITLTGTTQGAAGPATPFTVSGSNLTPYASVQLTAPAGCQISLSASSGFSSLPLFVNADANGDLASTQVYARMNGSSGVSGLISVVDSTDNRGSVVTVSGTVQPATTLNINFLDASATVGITGSATITFTVSLTQSLTTDLSLPYQTQDGSARSGIDYDPPSGSPLVIPAGQVTGSVTVTIHGTAALGDRTFFLVLSDPSGYVLNTHSACGTIHAQISPATIGGLVWNDLNTNGSPDSGEPGLAGWMVTLQAGLQNQTAVTDANGRYSFSGLAAGTYALSVAAPTGWNISTPVGGTYSKIVSAGDNVSDANFGCQIQSAITSQNYAVLFSGGLNPAENFSRYYNQVKALYQELISDMGLSPANVYILYADGTNSAADENTSDDAANPTDVNSDMSFVDAGTTVEAATKSDLQNLLAQLAGKIGSQDHFLFWTFDHGSKVNQETGLLGFLNQFDFTEYLVPWVGSSQFSTSDLISNQELGSWLNGIHAGYTTYVFNQCFAGGMFDDLNLTGNTFGCAAASYYEPSEGDYFAAGFTAALKSGLDNGQAAFNAAFNADGQALPGGGSSFTTFDPIDGYEHPWDAGGNFPIFSTPSCRVVNNLAVTPLAFDPSLTQVTISYDMLLASLDGVPDSNVGLSFRIDSVDSGTLSLSGQTVQPDVTQLTPGQTLTWTRSASGSGEIDAFHVSAWENGQQLGSSVAVNLSFSSPNSLTAAVNDSATIAENAPATSINVLLNDVGLGTLQVLQVGAAQHGYVTLQNGQVFYQPDPDYTGLDSFSYTMTDGSSATSLATVTVTVAAMPQNPQTIFHLFQVAMGTTSLLDASQGDYDPNGTAVTLTVVGAAQHGTVQLFNGEVQYTADDGYVGADQFAYTITDGNGVTNGGIAYLTVAPTVNAGLFDPQTSTFYLRNSDSPGLGDFVIPFQPTSDTCIPVAGDWTGSGTTRPGLYDPTTGTFYLLNSNTAGSAYLTVVFRPTSDACVPVVGDWTGSGTTTIGVYDPTTTTFYERDSNTSGGADVTFVFGLAGHNWVPVTGDWTGSGKATVGLYNPATSVFYMRSVNAAGAPDMAFQYGPANSNLIPLAGDWYYSGTTTIGLYDPQTSVFSLRNSNTAGYADTAFEYGPAGANWMPIVGDWSGSAKSQPALAGAEPAESANSLKVAVAIASQSIIPTVETKGPGSVSAAKVLDLTAAELQPIVAAAIDRWSAAGLDAADVAKLSHAQIVIAALPDNYLGLTQSNQVLIDPTADGHGWFIDPMPASDTKFAQGSDGQLHAIAPQAVDRIDLLTVLEHELGHIVGLDDRNDGQTDIMDQTLGVGIRRDILAADVDAVLGEL